MSNFYHCANCKEFFDRKELLIDKGAIHCPHCGGLVSPALAHVDHSGGKIPERKIFKYPLTIDDEIEISMPEGSNILTVQTQAVKPIPGIDYLTETPCIWAIVDPDAPLTTRRLCIRGTGHAFKGNEGKYIGTFQTDNVALVFHVFEERKK
jgi:DNA-directed RNA polymerase subunit RPC12/RpoP